PCERPGGAAFDRLAVDRDASDLRMLRQGEHEVEKEALDDRLQGARPGAALARLARDRPQRRLLETELDAAQPEEVLVVPDRRVRRAREYREEMLRLERVE